MLKKILLPSDGSEYALRAAAYVADLLRERPGMQVTILNVYRVLPEFSAYDFSMPTGLVDSLKQMSLRALDKTEGVFRDAGLMVEAVSREGDPGREIPQFARDGGYDHIVMGSRGAGSVSRFIFGSVAQKVLQLATCPVVVIK